MSNPYDFMQVYHHLVAGVYSKECHLPVGITFSQHKHKFSHMSILAQGKAIVEVDGIAKEYNAPAVLKIEANKIHSVTAVTPVIWHCIHPIDENEFSGDFDEIDIEFIKE